MITEYIKVLQPFEEATLSLEPRGKSGKFGAIYEILPTFEAVLKAYEIIIETYEAVNFEEKEALEDHLIINLKAT